MILNFFRILFFISFFLVMSADDNPVKFSDNVLCDDNTGTRFKDTKLEITQKDDLFILNYTIGNDNIKVSLNKDDVKTFIDAIDKFAEENLTNLQIKPLIEINGAKKDNVTIVFNGADIISFYISTYINKEYTNALIFEEADKLNTIKNILSAKKE